MDRRDSAHIDVNDNVGIWFEPSITYLLTWSAVGVITWINFYQVSLNKYTEYGSPLVQTKNIY